MGLAVSAANAQEPTSLDETNQSSEPQVRFVTNLGAFTIGLDRTRAPLTGENFLNYARNGHFQGTIFHRFIQGFVAQAGGFTPELQEKPPHDEGTVNNESGNGLSNLRGSIGLARGNEPHAGKAQFYINLSDNTDLNPRPTRWGYAVFGKIIEGMEIVDQIGHVPVGASGQFDRDVPLQPIIIETVELIND